MPMRRTEHYQQRYHKVFPLQENIFHAIANKRFRKY